MPFHLPSRSSSSVIMASKLRKLEAVDLTIGLIAFQPGVVESSVPGPRRDRGFFANLASVLNPRSRERDESAASVSGARVLQ